jgi:hypothetical protein
VSGALLSAALTLHQTALRLARWRVCGGRLSALGARATLKVSARRNHIYDGNAYDGNAAEAIVPSRCIAAGENPAPTIEFRRAGVAFVKNSRAAWEWELDKAAEGLAKLA